MRRTLTTALPAMPDLPPATTSPSESALRARVEQAGYAFVHGADMRELLGRGCTGADWNSFAASWNDLRLDTYMADGGRYRLRRHATLSAAPGSVHVQREAHRPHYQSLDYNPMHGGVERWFEPMADEVVEGPTMSAICAFCCRLFGALRPGARWHIEAHQFRIEARAGAMGKPTPEGLHRDGVDYVLVLLVGRVNIARGTTDVHDLSGHPLGSFTLTEACDAAIVDDARVQHGVTPVAAIDAAAPAFRDVLVLTFRAQP
jgi:hypothetical protein